MSARIVEIAEAIGDQLTAAIAFMPVAIDSVTVAPFAVTDISETANPKIYVSYQTTSQIESESFRDVLKNSYALTIVVVDFIQLGTGQELNNLTELMQFIRKLVTDSSPSGAAFDSIADETPVEEIDVAAVETGQCFKSELPVVFFEFLERV